MLILGFCGGPDPVYPSSDPVTDFRIVHSPFWFHDAAAVLVRDGEVVAGIEEERLNRIKHTNRFPAGAIEFCLADQGVTFDDVDLFVYYSREDSCNLDVGAFMLQHPWAQPFWTGRDLLCEVFRRQLGRRLDPRKLVFVDHHTAGSARALVGAARRPQAVPDPAGAASAVLVSPEV